MSILGKGIHVIESEIFVRRVQKFHFFAQHYFKAERYIYIVIFEKHLSELYWVILR